MRRPSASSDGGRGTRAGGKASRRASLDRAAHRGVPWCVDWGPHRGPALTRDCRVRVTLVDMTSTRSPNPQPSQPPVAMQRGRRADRIALAKLRLERWWLVREAPTAPGLGLLVGRVVIDIREQPLHGASARATSGELFRERGAKLPAGGDVELAEDLV